MLGPDGIYRSVDDAVRTLTHGQRVVAMPSPADGKE
jgi:hypothetical protein